MKNCLSLLMAASVSLAASANGAGQFTDAAKQNFVTSPVMSAQKSVSFRNVAPVRMTAVKANHSNASTIKPMADLVASYQGPAAFYWGFGEDGSGYAMTNYISASYTDLTWKNTSTGATSSVWSYTDPTWMSETPLQAFSTDLTLNYELYGQADCPTLTVSDGAMQAEYSNGDIFQAGLYATADGTNCLGASMFDLGNYSADGYLPYFGYDNGVDNSSYWQSQLPTYQDVKLEGFAVMFPKPAATYSISRVWINALAVFPAGTEIGMKIYSIDDEGYIEEMASGTFVAEQDFTGMGEDPMIAFDVVQYEDGWEVAGAVNVSTAILVEICDFGGQDITYFQPVFHALNVTPEEYEAANGQYYTYVHVSYDNGEEERGQGWLNPTYNVGTDRVNYYPMTSFDIMTDATFAWLFAEGLTDNTVALPTNGGTADVELNSLWTTGSLAVGNDADFDGVVDDADWLSYEFSASDPEVQPAITFTADALPAGTTGRGTEVEITTIGGDPLVLYVTQGESGVESAVVASAAKVDVVDGDFVITAPASINAVSVYNIAGQLINTAAVDGTTTVDGASLAQGVYILKFNDGSSVKVVK